MKVSQIKTFMNENDVNEWLKANHHIEVVNVNVSIAGENYGRRTLYLIHYKVNAKLGDESK
jgi:hypothetical protein